VAVVQVLIVFLELVGVQEAAAVDQVHLQVELAQLAKATQVDQATVVLIVQVEVVDMEPQGPQARPVATEELATYSL
jgi:hypothetical protein